MKFHLLALSSSLLLGAGLSAIQPGNFFLGWLLFSSLFLLSFYALHSIQVHTYTGTQVDTERKPLITENRTLITVVTVAFLLRLALGAALYLALPVAGYDNPQSRAGYIFYDSFRRDEQAWELAHSDAPILSAFNKNFYSDQYGGLLAFMAASYRFLSPDAHRPLLPVFFAALTAALGAAFLWKAAARQWDEKIAFAAAWIYALYPDSILFGSAQMREPFLMAFVAMALWGFVKWQTAGRVGGGSRYATNATRPAPSYRDQRRGWLWLFLGFAGMLLVSPAIAILALIILVGWWWIQREHGRLSWIALVAAGLVFLASLYLLAWGLERQQAFGTSPLGIIMDWFRAAVKWDIYQLQLGSGVVQKRFTELPEALHPLFVIIYGITQPVLPAALTEPTVPLFRVLMTFRALGWYALVPLLFYAPIASFQTSRGPARRLWLWLTAVAWLWIIISALRGGADQWDNPRYRAILIAVQALVAGFAWIHRDRWLVRWLAVEVVFVAVFTQWYVSRYYATIGRISFGLMVTVILVAAALILGGGWLWDRRKKSLPS